MTIDQTLTTVSRALADVSDAPRLEARRLLEHVLGATTAWLISHNDQRLLTDQAQQIQRLVARRQAGEPLAYVLGSVGFWDMDLAVDARVLVPRPDTETLIEAVLARRNNSQPLSLVDLGTGSGAIAIALARERPNWQVTATDASADALACAQANIDAWAPGRIDTFFGHWLGAVDGRRFAVIVSNPPYIDPADRHLEAPALKHEPASALVAADHGEADLAAIIVSAPAHLSANGLIALEHGYRQGAFVRQQLAAAGFSQIETVRDLGGRPRVSLAVSAG